MIIRFPDKFNPSKLMFKLQVNVLNESEWKDVSYPPSDYDTASKRLTHYNIVWGNVHSYRILPVK